MLIKMLAITTKEQDHWDTLLPFITMTYSATPKENTGITPTLLMYGRETTMPVDLMVGLPPNHPQSSTEQAKHLR